MELNEQYYSTVNEYSSEESVNTVLSEITHAVKELLEIKKSVLLCKSMMKPGNQYSVNVNSLWSDSVKELSRWVCLIVQKFEILMKYCSDTISLLVPLLKEDLDLWRREQESAAMGYTRLDPGYLNSLQKKYENQIKMIRKILEIGNQAYYSLSDVRNSCDPAGYTEQFNSLENSSTQLYESLISLVNATFVIKIQPPRIIETKTKYSAEICSLIGCLLQSIDPPKNSQQPSKNKIRPVDIHAIIINEEQANLWLHREIDPNTTCGDLTLDEGEKMNYDDKTGEFSAKLTTLTLNDHQRSGKNDSDGVDGEKFHIVFRANFTLIGKVNIIAVAMSLPIAVIVNSNQEARAKGYIVWDYGYSHLIRSPSKTFDAIKWSDIEVILNKEASVIGVSLCEKQLKHLSQRLIEWNFMDYNSKELTMSKFCEDYLPNTNLTLYEWIYHIFILIKEKLKDLHADELLRHAFVSKVRAEKKLLKSPPGTFLLRFSDTTPGGISIAKVETDTKSGKNVVIMRKPNDYKTLSEPLANNVLKLKSLQYLYPNISKEKAFLKHYRIFRNPQDDYVLEDTFSK